MFFKSRKDTYSGRVYRPRQGRLGKNKDLAPRHTFRLERFPAQLLTRYPSPHLLSSRQKASLGGIVSYWYTWELTVMPL